MSEYFEDRNGENKDAENADISKETQDMSVNENQSGEARQNVQNAQDVQQRGYTWNAQSAGQNAQNTQQRGYTWNAQSAGQNAQNTQQRGYTWNAQNAGQNVYGYGQGPSYGTRVDNGYGYATPIYGNEPAGKKEKKGISGGWIALIVALCLIVSSAAAIGGAYYFSNKYFKDANIGVNKETEKTGDKEVNADTEIETDLEAAKIIKSESQPREVLDGTIAAATQKAYNTVVEISTEVVEYDIFYGQYVTGGAGSGVIISENGYILTCAHVVDDASTVTVMTTDGKKYDAKIIGSDAQTDVAVLKINASGLDHAIICETPLVLGETVIAIGNPLGTLGGTVTNGIVSALDREVVIDHTTYHLLQTNAEINPGNSGGGLFNIDGELVGIVNAKSAGSEIEGLGFAIPIERAVDIGEQLINDGYIKGRPALGINVVEVTEYSDLYGIRSTEPDLLNYITDYGVYVTAWKSGDFKYGDRIIAIDDISVSTYTDITSALGNYNVGDKVSVTVSRINGRQSRMCVVEVVLTEKVPETSDSGN